MRSSVVSLLIFCSVVASVAGFYPSDPVQFLQSGGRLQGRQATPKSVQDLIFIQVLFHLLVHFNSTLIRLQRNWIISTFRTHEPSNNATTLMINTGMALVLPFVSFLSVTIDKPESDHLV